MRCESCGKDNAEGSGFCKECAAPLGQVSAGPAAEALESGEKPSRLARFISTAWSRKGPILMAFFVVLMMAVVFAPWAFLKLDVLGFRIISNSYNGWDIIVPRILFFLALIPLIVSLMLIAGVGTRRRVLETHICTFFAGVMFTVWVTMFVLSKVISSVVKNVRVLALNVSGGQIATIFLLLGFIIGIIVTTYDRGQLLEDAGIGG